MKNLPSPDANTCCVIVTGTNAVGKTTLAKAFIDRFGGISRIENQTTFTNGGPALAGPYGCSSGGVDRIKDADGNSATSPLASVVEAALNQTNLILCEGSRLDTFGLNLTNAIFKAKRQLVVFLCAPLDVIYNRLVERSGVKERAWRTIAAKQRQAARAAEKFRSIGVPVMWFDTSKTQTDTILNKILDFAGFPS